MTRSSRSSPALVALRQATGLRRAVSLLTLAAFCLLPLQAQSPAWWGTRGVLKSGNTSPDDYAVINQGQLKTLAAAAVAELNDKLVGGAGVFLNNLVASWQNPTVDTDDYATVNLGQLKSLAAPFYDRLGQAYPWAGSIKSPDDYALANIGQAKTLFSFAPQRVLPAAWLAQYGLPPGTDPNDIIPGSGEITGADVTYWSALESHLDPNSIADSDDDHIKDTEDAVPYDPALNFSPAALPHYAVIDLEAGTSPILGPAGQMLWGSSDPPAGGRYWPSTTGEANGIANLSTSPFPVGGSPAIAQDGSVVGVGVDLEASLWHQQLFRWNQASVPALSWLAEPPGLLAPNYLYYAQAINLPGPGGKIYSTPLYVKLSPTGSAGYVVSLTATPLSGLPAANLEEQPLDTLPALPAIAPSAADMVQDIPEAGHHYEMGILVSSPAGVIYWVRDLATHYQAVSQLHDDGDSLYYWDRQAVGTVSDVRTTYLLHTDGSKTALQAGVPAGGAGFHSFSGTVPDAASVADRPWLTSSKLVAIQQPPPYVVYQANLWEPAGGDTYAKHPIFGSKEDYAATPQRPLNYASYMDRAHRIMASGPVRGEDRFGLWVNGELHDFNEFIDESTYGRYTGWSFRSMNSAGQVAATATITKDANGNTLPSSQQKTHVLFLTPVELVQPTIAENGTVGNLAHVDEVRFCRWIDAFTAPNTLAPQFWKTDRDRFRLRIKADLPSGTQPPYVKVSTIRSNSPSNAYGTALAEYEDNATAIPLFKTSDGNFETPDLLMVADAVDDQANIGGVIDNHDVTTGTNADEPHDVTHVGMLGGKLQIELMINGSSADVSQFDLTKPKNRVELDAVVLTDPNQSAAVQAGQRADAVAMIDRQMKVAQVIYAQLGIEVKKHVADNPVAETDTATLNKLKFLFRNGWIQTNDGGSGPNADDAKALMEIFEAFRQVPSTEPSKNVVALYLPVYLNNPSGGWQGNSCSREMDGRAYHDKPPYDGFAFVSVRDINGSSDSPRFDDVLAHETGHVMGLRHTSDNLFLGPARTIKPELMFDVSAYLRDIRDRKRFHLNDQQRLWISKRLILQP